MSRVIGRGRYATETYPQSALGGGGGSVLGTLPLTLSGAGGWFSKTNPVNAVQKQIELVGSLTNLFVAQFPAAVQSFFEWGYPIPSQWGSATVMARVQWLAQDASTNPVVWGLQGRIYAPGDPLDAAMGAAVETTSANTGNELMNYSATFGPITLAGVAGSGRHAQFRLYRLGSGADTLAAAANMLETVLTLVGP